MLNLTIKFNAIHIRVCNAPVDGVVDPSAAAKKVSKLSLKNWRTYKRGLPKMDPHSQEAAAVQNSAAAQEVVAAAVKERVKRRALRTKEFVAAPWRSAHPLKPPSQRHPPPLPCESPPRSSKSAA